MKKIKCPNYNMSEGYYGRSCYDGHPFADMGAQEFNCRINIGGKPPCNNGFIDKKEYEKLAYPKSDLERMAFRRSA